MGLILSCIFHFIERRLRRQDQISNHEHCSLSISTTPEFVKSCCGSYISNIRKISLTWLSAICRAFGRRRGSILMGQIFSCIFRFIKKCMCRQDQVETEDLYRRNEDDSVATSKPELLESLNDTNSSIDMVEENDQGVTASAHVLDVDNLEEKTENRCPERWLQHYTSSHKMLLVGEGDFSFSASLAIAFGSATNMVATSLDSRETLLEKYTGALANLKALDDLGCTIVHEVDATTMSQHALLKSDSFDRIVFNFPHAGFFYKEHETTQIELHQKLMKGFLWNAYEMLTENGEVHITHKTAHPFSMWNIEKLAEEVGLGLLDKVPFSEEEYPGYHSKRGHGIKCDRSFGNGEGDTFIFQKQSCLIASQSDAFSSLNDTNSTVDMVEENDQGFTASAHVLGVHNLEAETENSGHANQRRRKREKGKRESSGPERWLRHYCSSYKILLVGEGDFSFSASLAVAFGSATNMVATSLDSREMLLLKYSGAKENLKNLEELGCTIVHEVNANTMSQHALLKSLHKKLVKGFLRNAYEMLTEKGEVHITHKTAHPFNVWNIEKLAEEVGLRLLNKVPFSKEEYPGYENMRGHGIKCNESFAIGECSTFMFQKQSRVVVASRAGNLTRTEWKIRSSTRLKIGYGNHFVPK
ncbi:hypothetical protein PTKIN_Ptkin14bG0003000 [Pterospermum kingtungense]